MGSQLVELPVGWSIIMEVTWLGLHVGESFSVLRDIVYRLSLVGRKIFKNLFLSGINEKVYLSENDWPQRKKTVTTLISRYTRMPGVWKDEDE